MRVSRAGLARPTAAFTGFGTDWFDYDNDGWLDLFIANGAVNIIESQRGQPAPYRMRNQLFRNTGRGRFDETSAAARPGVRARRDQPRRGVRRRRQRRRHRRARHDEQRTGAIAVEPVRRRGTTGCRSGCDTTPGERFGMGARVGIERAGQPTLWRRVKTDGSYLSASDIRVHFGLGAVGAHRCRRRRVARRRARALEGRGRGSAGDVAARER